MSRTGTGAGTAVDTNLGASVAVGGRAIGGEAVLSGGLRGLVVDSHDVCVEREIWRESVGKKLS
jgi:hypothetical protein